MDIVCFSVMRASVLLLFTLALCGCGWFDGTEMISDNDQTRHTQKLLLARELQAPGPVSRVFWSSDGSRLAAANTGPDGDLLIMKIPNPSGSQITIWDSTGNLLKHISRGEAFFDYKDSLAFVKGNDEIVAPPSMLSKTLAFSVFDAESGKIVHEVAGSYPDRPRNVNALTNLAVSPDESIIAVVFGRALPQPVALYSTRDWSKIGDLADRPKNLAEEPQDLAFSDDGRLLAVSGFGQILIYDVQMRQRIRTIESFPGTSTNFVRFAEGNAAIVAGSKLPGLQLKPIYVFSVENGATLASHEKAGGVTSFDSSRDGRLVGFITGHHRLHLWDRLRPQEEEPIVELGDWSESLKFSPSGDRLAVAVGKHVKVFEVLP